MQFRHCLVWVSIFLAAAPAWARINVVTLPERDSVQLTIYNSVDLTLVRETRILTFRKGINHLEFSWANTLIDPTSVEFRPRTHADAVDVLDISFPPRVANTLEWRIQSEVAGEVEVEIRYFTSGISWAADYVAEASQSEKTMALAGDVRVNNKSGEDYENTSVRLVVGTVRLVENIVQLARAGREGPTTQVINAPADSEAAYSSLNRAVGAAGGMGGGGGRGGRGGGAGRGAAPAEIVKEEMSEYFLYSVEGEDTILNGWSKRLPSFQTNNIPIASYYKFEKERYGDRVMRYYRFTNSIANKLGKEPLPDGQVKAFRIATDDKLYAFVGRTSVKYIPINEFVEMELGSDREVMVKPTLMNWEKTNFQFDERGSIKGWTVKETWEFEVQNSKEIDIILDIRRNFNGDWSLATGTTYEKVDANKVKFVIPLKPKEKQKFTYDLTTNFGSNITK
jgi:hypothetical protein